MSGTRPMPAGFPMEPSGTPAAFPCETTSSGSTGYAASEMRKVRIRPVMIAIRMKFIPGVGFRWVMKMGEGIGEPGVVTTSYIRFKKNREAQVADVKPATMYGANWREPPAGKKRKSVDFCRLPDFDAGYPGKIAIVGRDG
jgi:hypothetical protein